MLFMAASAPAGIAEDGTLARPFAELRFSFAKSPSFGGIWTADPDRERVIKALAEKRTQEFLALSDAWLARCPVDARVHLARAGTLSDAGDATGAAHHRFVFYGLLESVLASGNGRSKATAYRVISVDEEYTLLNFIGATLVTQHLDGTVDVLDVSVNGAASTIYFDVAPGLAATQRALGAR